MMAKSIVLDHSARKLPADTQVKYLSIQAELDLLFQQIRSAQDKTVQKF